VEKRCDGLLVGADPLFNTRRIQLATLSVRHMLPAIYPVREFAEAGGLTSYGPDNADRHRLVGVYTARISRAKSPRTCP
jgi:putative ABC transport system substrate-binding protein